MDAQIASGIDDHLRSSWVRGEIAKFFNRNSSDPEVEVNRKRFISQLNLKNGDEYTNVGMQQILENTLLAGSQADKLRIGEKFTSRVQTAIANLPEQEYTVPQAGPPQDLNTTVAEDAGLNQSMQLEGLDYGGRKRKTRRKQRKHRKTRHRR
jgi:hypothetical protein